MNIKLIITYVGTNYSGWQVQKNALTVQEKIQDAVESLFGKRYSITGCSRTDSGVHAKSFCCVVSTCCDSISIPENKIAIALNQKLPDDISVKSAEFVSEDFHPRYDVKYKEYEYLIWNSEIKEPFLNNRAFMYPKHLDTVKMQNAANYFVGKHDFKAFMSSGSDVVDTVRNIKYFNVSRAGNLIKINVAADGFLYNMVRILVGTLIDASIGRIDENSISDIINEKKRERAGFTAPAQGLYLNKVIY